MFDVMIALFIVIIFLTALLVVHWTLIIISAVWRAIFPPKVRVRGTKWLD